MREILNKENNNKVYLSTCNKNTEFCRAVARFYTGEIGEGIAGFEHPDCGHTEKAVSMTLSATQTVVTP